MKLQIETYHGCNARCSICTINRWTRPKGPIDDALFQIIVEQALELPDLEVVSLYMDGEPLLDKNIVQRIQQCKTLSLPHIGFSSNASLLTRENSIALLEAGQDWIAISLDSMDAASFEGVRKRLDHATVVKNVHSLIEERDKRNSDMEIALRYLAHDDNAQTFDEYEEYWKKYLRDTDKLINVHCHNWGEDGDTSDVISTNCCEHPFTNMVVLSDGTVPMCCVDYNAEMTMGHVQEQTLLDIWNGEAFNRIRTIHTEGQRNTISRCKNCTV